MSIYPSTHKGAVSKIALALLATGGILVALAVAPGLGAALKLIDPNPRKAMDKLERALRRLIKNGDVEFEPGKFKRYRLTTAGARKLARLQFVEYILPQPKKAWDGKWWVVCFDIPETEQYVRRLFQTKLSGLRFYRLQNSIFVYPYPCTELLKLTHQAFELQKHVRMITAESIDNEKILLNFFHLKK